MRLDCREITFGNYKKSKTGGSIDILPHKTIIRTKTSMTFLSFMTIKSPLENKSHRQTLFKTRTLIKLQMRSNNCTSKKSTKLKNVSTLCPKNSLKMILYSTNNKSRKKLLMIISLQIANICFLQIQIL